MLRQPRSLGVLLLLLLVGVIALASQSIGGPGPFRDLTNVVVGAIVGAIVALAATIYVERKKREQLVEDLAIALYEELANRVARCCFDFEAPWSNEWAKPTERSVFEVMKFIPQPPTIFDGNADKLALLGPRVPAAMMAFYFRLWVLRRDVETLCATEINPASNRLPASYVRVIALRMAETLAPGLTALQCLGDAVGTHEAIDAAAWATFERPPNPRENYGPLRQRLVRVARIVEERFAKGE